MKILTVSAWLAICSLFLGLSTISQAAGTWQLTEVQRVSQMQGWALGTTEQGEALLKTSDGGKSWRNVSPKSVWPLSPAQIQENLDVGVEGIDFHFLDGREGWVALENNQDQVIVERTHDGGQHWAKSHFADYVGYGRLRLSFQDRMHGWVLTISDMASGSTRKALYKTVDRGKTWAAVTQAIPDHIDPTGVTFRNAIEGWLSAGYHGSDNWPLYHTDDAGRHWSLQEIDVPSLFQDGYGVFYTPSFFGARRRDGLMPVLFHSQQSEWNGIILYRTHDAGQSWQRLRHLPHEVIGFSFGKSINFISKEKGWALTDTGPGASLLSTNDGGKHWRTVYPTRKKMR